MSSVSIFVERLHWHYCFKCQTQEKAASLLWNLKERVG